MSGASAVRQGCRDSSGEARESKSCLVLSAGHDRQPGVLLIWEEIVESRIDHCTESGIGLRRIRSSRLVVRTICHPAFLVLTTSFILCPLRPVSTLAMSDKIVNSVPYPFTLPDPLTKGQKFDPSVLSNSRGARPSVQASRLRELFNQGYKSSDKALTFVLSYDGLSSRLIEEAGFQAIFLGGYAMSASAGLPDAGYIAFGEVSQKIAEVARQVSQSMAWLRAQPEMVLGVHTHHGRRRHGLRKSPQRVPHCSRVRSSWSCRDHGGGPNLAKA